MFQINDIINGSFEMIGAYFTIANAYKLHIDKAIKGVYWKIWIFYCGWGVWNLYYYPSLDQWISFIAGILMVVGNIVWLILAIKYRNNK